MDKLPNTSKAAEHFGKETVKRARFNLNLKGFGGQKSNRKKNASGALSKSLDYNIVQEGKGVAIEFEGNKKYAAIVEEGRKKGKYVPIAPLEQWIRNKRSLRLFVIRKPNGVKVSKSVAKNEQNIKSAAIAMSKSIKKTGIKAVPYFEEAMNTTFDRMKPELQDALVMDMEDIIVTAFKKDPNVTVR